MDIKGQFKMFYVPTSHPRPRVRSSQPAPPPVPGPVLPLPDGGARAGGADVVRVRVGVGVLLPAALPGSRSQPDAGRVLGAQPHGLGPTVGRKLIIQLN